MQIDLSLIIQVLGFIGGVVGVWVNLNTKITKLEAQVETNRGSIEKIAADRKEITDELKEIKALLTEMQLDMKLEIKGIKTYQELKNNESK